MSSIHHVTVCQAPVRRGNARAPPQRWRSSRRERRPDLPPRQAQDLRARVHRRQRCRLRTTLPLACAARPRSCISGIRTGAAGRRRDPRVARPVAINPRSGAHLRGRAPAPDPKDGARRTSLEVEHGRGRVAPAVEYLDLAVARDRGKWCAAPGRTSHFGPPSVAIGDLFQRKPTGGADSRRASSGGRAPADRIGSRRADAGKSGYRIAG